MRMNLSTYAVGVNEHKLLNHHNGEYAEYLSYYEFDYGIFGT